MDLFLYATDPTYSLSPATTINTILSAPSGVINGVSWVFYWADMEPSQGVYDWGPGGAGYLETALAAGAAAGLKQMVRITAGIHSPSWLLPSVCGNGLVDAVKNIDGTIMPLLWSNQNSLNYWLSFITALGKQIGNDSRIHRTQMPLVGRAGEMAIGSSGTSSPTNGWESNNAICPWTSAGAGSYAYAPGGTYLAACRQVIQTWASNFTQLLALDIGEPDSVATPLAGDDLYVLPAWANSLLGPRCSIQFNGWGAGFHGIPAPGTSSAVAEQIVGYAASGQNGYTLTTAGLQQNAAFYNTANEWSGNVQQAMRIGAQYIEIYKQDIVDTTPTTVFFLQYLASTYGGQPDVNRRAISTRNHANIRQEAIPRGLRIAT